MGIDFALGQLEIVEMINDKIVATEHYLKLDEEYLKELVDKEGDKFSILIARGDVRKGTARIKSLKLYAKSVASGIHIFTLDEIKALETL